jgi:hypothetical protein
MRTALNEWINCKDYIDEKIPADIMKKDKTVFIELKNKHNTMNGGSRKTVYENLINIKKKNPEALVVLGIINTKNNNSYKKKINDDDEPDIYEYGGEELFNLVYNSKSYMDDLLQVIQEYTKSDKNKSDKNKSDKNKSDKDKSDKNKSDKDKSDKKPKKIVKKK